MTKVRGKQIQPNFIDEVTCPVLTAEVKYFKIQHPTKKDKALYHSSLEGPEHAVYFRNKIEVNKNGSIIIEFPKYWDNLIDYENCNIFITPFGGYSKYYLDFKNNKWIINYENEKPILFQILIIAERIDIAKLDIEPEEYYNKEEFFSEDNEE